MPILTPHSQEESWHERKMKRHVKLIPLSKIGTDIGRPLVGLREKDASLIRLIDPLSNFLQIGVSFGKVLADRAFPLKQIRDRVTAKSVETLIEPEGHDIHHGLLEHWVIVVQIRLVTKKSMPVIGLRDGIPGPVRLLGIDKDNSCFL